MLTIFSAPKSFTNPHIATIQCNAIGSWLRLGTGVEVILIGEEDGLAEAAASLGVQHLPTVGRNAQGTPFISSIFSLARDHARNSLLAYVNADILLFADFVDAAQQVARARRQFLIVGQRWDLDVCVPIGFSPGWQQRLLQEVDQHGRLHPPGGSDYFIYPKECYQEVPDFAVGRAGWDNWMIYQARTHHWAVVDATSSVRIIHQDHDYSHLPGGQPHYRLPETAENVRLAGGKRAIFGLIDADRRLEGQRLLPQRLTWKKFWREVEIFPLVRLHSMLLGQIFFAIFHPHKAYMEFRKQQKNTS